MMFYTFDGYLTKFKLLALQQDQNERYNLKNKEVTAIWKKLLPSENYAQPDPWRSGWD